MRKRQSRLHKPPIDEGRVLMSVPQSLDIFGNFDTTIRFLRKIPIVVLNDRREIALDFTHVQSVSISALLVLAAEIQRCSKILSKARIYGNFPIDDRIEWMLEDTGLSLFSAREMIVL